MSRAAWSFILLAAAAAIAVTVLSFVQHWRRRRALRYLARRLGLAYAERDDALAERLGFLSSLGGRVIARNALSGTYEGRLVHVFDAATGRRSFVLSRRPPSELTCLVLEHEGDFPELLISPRVAKWDVDVTLREDDVEFESAEFEKAFRVRSKDRKFAYDICHSRMMEYLLGHRDLSIEIEGPCVALSFDKQLNVQEIPRRLRQLVEVRGLFPEYLYKA